MLPYPIWILQWWHWTNMSSIGDWLSLLLSVTRFFFFFQCSASLIKSLVNTSWCVFLHRDADGDSHWYDYQANAKYAISCYSSHLVIYRLQCVLVLLFCFNPLDCFFKVKTKTIPYNLNYTLAATSCWVVRDHLVQPVLLVKLSYSF